MATAARAPAAAVGSTVTESQAYLRTGPNGPMFKMDGASSARLNTPTSGRQRMRGSAAPLWLRAQRPTGPRVQNAALAVEPTEPRVQPDGGAAAAASSPRSPTTSGTVVGVTGPLKSLAQRQRKVPPAPPIQADGSSIPSMRGGGGWTPRWEALQAGAAPLSPMAIASSGAITRVADPGNYSERRFSPGGYAPDAAPRGLHLAADQSGNEAALAGHINATTVRSPVTSSGENEQVYYKFSPRRARFATTANGIAGVGSPR